MEPAELGQRLSKIATMWTAVVQAHGDQAASTVKDIPKDQAGKFFDDNFGKQFRELYSRAKDLAERAGVSESDRAASASLLRDLDQLKKAWDGKIKGDAAI